MVDFNHIAPIPLIADPEIRLGTHNSIQRPALLSVHETIFFL